MALLVSISRGATRMSTVPHVYTEKKSCQFYDFVTTVGTVSCHYDNLRCQQSRQICQINYLLFSVYSFWTNEINKHNGEKQLLLLVTPLRIRTNLCHLLMKFLTHSLAFHKMSSHSDDRHHITLLHCSELIGDWLRYTPIRTTNVFNRQCPVTREADLLYNNVIMGEIASQITGLPIVYLTFYSGANQRKHQGSASLTFVRGIHRKRHRAGRHQTIPWTNVHLPSKVFRGIHLTAISFEMLCGIHLGVISHGMNFIHKMCSEITLLKSLPYPPGAYEF